MDKHAKKVMKMSSEERRAMIAGFADFDGPQDQTGSNTEGQDPKLDQNGHKDGGH